MAKRKRRLRIARLRAAEQAASEQAAAEQAAAEKAKSLENSRRLRGTFFSGAAAPVKEEK